MMTSEEEVVEEKKPLEEVVEREHMFDKVVTPSDVGKLNRLVIPKQHAERYFPLDSSSNEKSLLLNFEDLTGKSWRFRYSYWNSSQSYVMTKGWSRFVKDKKLNAGDIVSFQRSMGDSGRETRLFIDWRRRPKAPEYPTSINHFGAGAMFPRFYSFPTTSSQSYNLYDHQQLRHHHSTGYNYSQIPREFGYGYFVRSLDQRMADPLVFESVPVMMHGGSQAHQAVVGTGGKRLRLFGVDMECGESGITNCTEEESSSSGGSLTRGGGDASSFDMFQLRLGNGSEDDHFTKKGKSSLSFDLDQ